MFTTSHSRRGALLVVLGLTATLTTIATPSVTGAARTSPCGLLGTLRTYELNDRCEPLLGLEPISDLALVASLRRVGLFAMLLTCAGQGISSAPVAAVPDELLVTASGPGGLDAALAEVRRRLPGSVSSVTPLNQFAATVELRPGVLNEGFLRQVIPTLQGRGFSTDLNYLEPALPNNHLRPGDNPITADFPGAGQGGGGRVLVIDSPTQGQIDYDVDGNGFVDEDHGHGLFVASLIEQLAPDAEVVLAGVDGGHAPASARWSPMVFADADIIAALGQAFGVSATGVERSFDVVNLSLGGAGCGGVGSRLALGRFLRDLAETSARTNGVRPVYVAAAGNDGGDVKHFPAAWRDEPTIRLTAAVVDLVGPPGAGDEIRAIQVALEADMLAVGSATHGDRDPFSNCGAWVNAVADGADTVSRYPSPTGWASWSGTSFATARVSASRAGGQGLSDVIVGAAIGAC
jgi:hypothetical protein